MCGLAGVLNADGRPVTRRELASMAGALRHRGPDGFGYYLGADTGLVHVRLSVIDLERSAQPLTNEDGTLVIVYNGEVYNYPELTRELVARGHRFQTAGDTEVIVHGYEEWGTGVLARLNGQFAFALYDRHRRRLLLARDRYGIRPLFYASSTDGLRFASEVKALFMGGGVRPDLDPAGLDQVFTSWAAVPPRTPFRGVHALEPGCFAVYERGRLRATRYYAAPRARSPGRQGRGDSLERLDARLAESVAVRLRADVPVGAYLSGGLDSTIAATLAARESPHRLRTFSVAFQDAGLDESRFQRLVAGSMGSEHHVLQIAPRDVGAVFPDVVWHAETPVLRTAAAPMFLLSRLTRDHGIKVVLTGEGADEVFWGYDLFKEVLVRRFCLRRPGSPRRRRLFSRLYPYLDARARHAEFWGRFFLGAGSPDDLLFSHMPRFLITARIKDLYSASMRESLQGYDAMQDLRDTISASLLPRTALERAAYLELVTLLSPYLLSSQGDRMSLAHGVEARYPFLDHHLAAFAAELPESCKLVGLREKVLLKRWAHGRVPAAVVGRAKQPYRAPDAAAFFGPRAPDYVEALLGHLGRSDSGVFDPGVVASLVRRCRAGRITSVGENQAVVAVLSTELWYQHFIADPRRSPPLRLEEADVALDDTREEDHAPSRRRLVGVRQGGSQQ